MPGAQRSGSAPVRPRNDPAQYDDLVDIWWAPRGRLAMLHWIAASRAKLVPPARRPGSLLLDVACGGGVLAPHLRHAGHRHLGVDLSASAVAVARQRGMSVVRGDARALPFGDEVADVVVAGEVLEHVPDLSRTVAEVCRVLRPGGTLVLDTIADTRLGRFLSVTVGERIPGGPPPRLHDPRLFVNRDRLRRECASHGVPLTLTGLRPSVPSYLGWLTGRRDTVPMLPTRLTAVLFQAYGVKES